MHHDTLLFLVPEICNSQAFLQIAWVRVGLAFHCITTCFPSLHGH
jgi:hypothetical protein